MSDATPSLSLTPLQRIFFPFASEEYERAVREKMRLAYYTKAETALKVIQNGEIWLRHTSAMNDVEEIRHGFSCIYNAWHRPEGVRLKTALEGCHPGITDEIGFRMDNGSLLGNVYVACFSEHGKGGAKHEEDIGRLSMWRAYGGRCGVAIIFNVTDMMAKNVVVPGLTLSPVIYAARYESGAEEIGKHFARIAEAVEIHAAFLASLPAAQVTDSVTEALCSAAICTKHHAFAEEQEWRAFWIAGYPPLAQLEPRLVTIDGLPQRIFCLKFSDYPSQSIAGQSIPALLERVLIGPCEQPRLVEDALRRALGERGITHGDCVIQTEIPLRL